MTRARKVPLRPKNVPPTSGFTLKLLGVFASSRAREGSRAQISAMRSVYVGVNVPMTGMP